MKVKVIKPMSKFFTVGQIVEMDVSENGDFRLSTDKFSQAFDFSYHDRVRPATNEELEE